MSNTLTFYFGSGSPYAWKVWLALEHKKLRYEADGCGFHALSLSRIPRSYRREQTGPRPHGGRATQSGGVDETHRSVAVFGEDISAALGIVIVMNAGQARTLCDLVREQTIAALGTLHAGEPYVSMVPYAQHAGGADFFIHVSRLATHTGDMIASPRVSLLIVARSGDSPQSLARVTVQGDSRQLATGSVEYAAAKACYIARFPHAADIFELADFSIFRIEPVSARVVGGFAQAFNLGAGAFARALRIE